MPKRSTHPDQRKGLPSHFIAQLADVANLFLLSNSDVRVPRLLNLL
jgi:hypothetical protein